MFFFFFKFWRKEKFPYGLGRGGGYFYCKLKKGSITLIFWEEKNFVYFDIVYFERMENFF